MRSENLCFSQVLSQCWRHWSWDHSLRIPGLNKKLFNVSDWNTGLIYPFKVKQVEIWSASVFWQLCVCVYIYSIYINLWYISILLYYYNLYISNIYKLIETIWLPRLIIKEDHFVIKRNFCSFGKLGQFRVRGRSNSRSVSYRREHLSQARWND